MEAVIKYKKWLFSAICFLLVFLTGCGSSPPVTEDNGRLNVITTIFPYYDFVRQVAGDKVDLKLVVPAGMDTHSFEPAASDMIDIGKADIIIYNGGEMEGWVAKVLQAASDNKIQSWEMMDFVDTVTEETVDGMQQKKHGHSGHDEDGEDGYGHQEYDEHIWTSPVNAIKLVSKISDILSDADKENSGFYHKNAKAYIKKLKGLDSKFRDIVNSSERKYLVFADRFPLRYFTDEYGINYSAAFAGCSSETEPGAETIVFLIDKVKEENIRIILKIELTSTKVADSIAEAAGAEVMTFYTCHNVTKEQFDSGITYYDLMEKNTGVLEKALGR